MMLEEQIITEEELANNMEVQAINMKGQANNTEVQAINMKEQANYMEGQAVPKEEQATSRVLGASITLKEKAIVTLLFMKLAKKPRTALWESDTNVMKRLTVVLMTTRMLEVKKNSYMRFCSICIYCK